MPERIRRRRPIAWNQLLNKGHVHEPGRSAARRAQRQALAADIDEYFNNLEQDQQPGPTNGAKDGADCYRGAISNAVQICSSTFRSFSSDR